MDEEKIAEILRWLGISRKDAYTLAVLYKLGATVNLQTGEVRWPHPQ